VEERAAGALIKTGGGVVGAELVFMRADGRDLHVLGERGARSEHKDDGCAGDLHIVPPESIRNRACPPAARRPLVPGTTGGFRRTPFPASPRRYRHRFDRSWSRSTAS